MNAYNQSEEDLTITRDDVIKQLKKDKSKMKDVLLKDKKDADKVMGDLASYE